MRSKYSRRTAAAAILVVGAFWSACSLIVGTDKIQGGDGPTSASSGATGGGGGGGTSVSSSSVASTAGQGGASTTGQGGAGGEVTSSGEGGGGGNGTCACAQCLKCTRLEEVEFTQQEQKVVTGVISNSNQALFSPKDGCTKADGPEHVVEVTNNSGLPGFLTAMLTRTGTKFNSVLSARKDCCTAFDPVVCADSNDGTDNLQGGEVISFPMSPGESRFVFVDGFDATSTGAFELVMSFHTGLSCLAANIIPVRVERGSPMVLRGTTAVTGASKNGCKNGQNTYIGVGTQIVYQITVADDIDTMNIKLVSTDVDNDDTVLYLRSACEEEKDLFAAVPMSHIVCVDVNTTSGEEWTPDYAGGYPRVLYVFADVGLNQSGPFDLILTPKP